MSMKLLNYWVVFEQYKSLNTNPLKYIKSSSKCCYFDMLHSFKCNWEAVRSLEQQIHFQRTKTKRKKKTSERCQLILGLKLLKYPRKMSLWCLYLHIYKIPRALSASSLIKRHKKRYHEPNLSVQGQHLFFLFRYNFNLPWITTRASLQIKWAGAQ